MRPAGKITPAIGTRSRMATSLPPLTDHQRKMSGWAFALMCGVYGDQFRRKYETETQIALGRQAWGRALGNLTEEELGKGARLMDTSAPRFPPTPSQFADMCRIAPEHRPARKSLPWKADRQTALVHIRKLREILT